LNSSIHRFLAHQSFYPILLSSLLGCVFYAGRVYLSHALTYLFLVENLALAWVPYLCSLWAVHVHRRYPDRWWYLALPCALWLLFFPNAPYIVTDLWHLHERAPIPMWYDIGLFVSFGWTGFFLGIVSLRAVQALVKTFAGWAASWLFVTGVVGLSGLGVYLGRFLRWNSWDLVLHPYSVLADAARQLAHPIRNVQTYGFILMFAALLLACFMTFTSIQSHES
jgi:uncharacterized membrane protein